MKPQHILTMTPASHSAWKPKRKGWRIRYAYRAQSLADLGKRYGLDDAKYQKARASEYVEWLAKQHGLTIDDAGKRAAAHRHCELLSSTDDRESTARVETWVSPSTCVRTVKNFSGPCRKFYGYGPVNAWTANDFDFGWHRLETYSQAPTLYRVMVNGILVDTYLTKARAMAKAQTLADFPAPFERAKAA